MYRAPVIDKDRLFKSAVENSLHWRKTRRLDIAVLIMDYGWRGASVCFLDIHPKYEHFTTKLALYMPV